MRRICIRPFASLTGTRLTAQLAELSVSNEKFVTLGTTLTSLRRHRAPAHRHVEPLGQPAPRACHVPRDVHERTGRPPDHRGGTHPLMPPSVERADGQRHAPRVEHLQHKLGGPAHEQLQSARHVGRDRRDRRCDWPCPACEHISDLVIRHSAEAHRVPDRLAKPSAPRVRSCRPPHSARC